MHILVISLILLHSCETAHRINRNKITQEQQQSVQMTLPRDANNKLLCTTYGVHTINAHRCVHVCTSILSCFRR